MDRLIMVSNRLPVRIEADGTARRTEGGLASALDGAVTAGQQILVGWPGGAAEEIEDPQSVADQLRRAGVEPVFLSRDEIDGFYEGYSNATLWPLLHYTTDRAKFSREWWESYRAVNRRFADTVLAVAQDGDQVWIHDYHLFLLPAMLRSGGKNLRIGFFLHTPFCSSEIFRALPDRAVLLEGVLGADLIGFHTYNYLRHFRSALLQVLGRESEIDGIWHHGRDIHLGVYPIGHNHTAFEQEISRPDFPALLDKYAAELNGKRLILNVERLDYTKGIPEKLRAISLFLEAHPEKRGQVVFVMIAVPSRQGVSEYDALTEEVQREVGAINGRFGMVGHAPLQFLHRGFPLADLSAFYMLAEVCMVTPLRDGMNLVAKEFLDCQRRGFPCRPGALILSEFAGAAHELSHAIHVNPHDEAQVAEAINTALDMPDDERWERIDIMRGRLLKQDNRAWARQFLGDLDKTLSPRLATDTGELGPLADQLAAAARSGRPLGLFLDYDGTLRHFVDVPERAVPDAALTVLLRDLAARPNVRLAVVSGRPPAFLETHLGGLGVTLVAEHGYRWRDGGDGPWQLLNPHVSNEWKCAVRPHLEQAALLTPGAHLEEKESALVWHYRAADPEFGPWRARSLLDELTSMTANLPVTVRHGQKIVEISSVLVSKGAAVEFLMHSWNCAAAFVAGDDQTDETMLTLAPENISFFTVKVGKGSSRARYRTDIEGLRAFLEKLRAGLA